MTAEKAAEREKMAAQKRETVARLAAEKKALKEAASDPKAKARQRKERREEEWCAHISHVRAVKRECADEPSMVPPPPPPVSFSL